MKKLNLLLLLLFFLFTNSFSIDLKKYGNCSPGDEIFENEVRPYIIQTIYKNNIEEKIKLLDISLSYYNKYIFICREHIMNLGGGTHLNIYDEYIPEEIKKDFKILNFWGQTISILFPKIKELKKDFDVRKLSNYIEDLDVPILFN